MNSVHDPQIATEKIFQSINPADGKVIAEYRSHSQEELEKKLLSSRTAFELWMRRPIAERARCLQQLGRTLLASQERSARLMSLEMGKPIAQARSEIEKCAALCRYYSEYGPAALAPEKVTGNSALRSYVRFDPLGAVLAVMPWNFPFWQVLRFAVPALLVGNVGVLKHATNVLGSAQAIEHLFLEAGFPEGVFISLNLDRTRIPDLISSSYIHAVTLTGSEAAGISVAQVAGQHLKKCVLELGGSDPFIVLADANLQLAIQKGVQARIINNGQSCIAAKRFLVDRQIAKEFTEGMAAEMRALRVGDPLQADVQLGPLARDDLRETLHQQVQSTITQGARLVTGGQIMDRPGWYYEPTVLADVGPEMTAFQEETFGPVATITSVEHPDEAVELANQSNFGLGASLWTSNLELAEQMAARLEAGSIFINDFTRSDATLPFGGVKRSGYGRELSHFGLREFTNIKTVWIGET